MSPSDFVYWLQGFFEMSDAEALSFKQVKMIKQHLALVLKNESKELTEKEIEEILGPKPGIKPTPWPRTICSHTKAC